ncbi:MAG: thermonuclease family protein [Alphaproteobacteria bacterium]
MAIGRAIARRWILALAVAGFALAGPVHAGDVVPGPVQARVVQIIDGDTLIVRAHIWLGQDVETSVRMSGIDAPELKGQCELERTRALASRDHLASRVAGGAVVLTQVRYEKYGGRVLAQVRLPDGTDLAHDMIATGHARSYDGGKRGMWCEEARADE